MKCLWDKCDVQVVVDEYCSVHKWMMRVTPNYGPERLPFIAKPVPVNPSVEKKKNEKRERRRKEYIESKKNGICTKQGCKEKSLPNHLMCHMHRERELKNQRKRKEKKKEDALIQK